MSVDLFFVCGGDHVFSNPGNAPLDAEQEADWQQIEAGPLKWVRHCRRDGQKVLDRIFIQEEL